MGPVSEALRRGGRTLVRGPRDPTMAAVPTRRFAALICALALAVALTLCARFARAEQSVADIAFVGTDSNVYVCSVNCQSPRCLTCAIKALQARAADVIRAGFEPSVARRTATTYGWPTFSPDGRKVAYVSSSGSPGAESFGVYVYDLGRSVATEVFESSHERPIYLFWLPGGKHFSFLVSEPDGRLSLMVAEVREGAPVRIVLSGAPLFFDWSRSAKELLVHTNFGSSAYREQVSLMSLSPTSQDVERVLARGEAPFKTPCWSPDQKHIAYVATKNDVAFLVLADGDGNNPRALAKLLPGQSSFVWAPDSRHIAFSTAQLPPNNVFDGVKIVDISDGKVRPLVKDGVAAFYFSPDSRRIAYIAVPPERPYYTWKVVDTAGGKSHKLASFVATNEQAIAAHYFDQLALSHRLWAPDSSAIVFAGVILKGEPKKPVPPMAAPPPEVTILPVDGGKPRGLAEGVVAFWSPAAK
jgi:WD40-like Beta Propeller Repeat